MSRGSSLYFSFCILGLLGRPLPAQMIDGPPPHLREAAREHFIAYERAISKPFRSSLAQFYWPVGVVVRTINGSTTQTTKAELDSMYRYRWKPPAFFAFDSLTFDSLDASQVIVTGTFRWQSAGSSDTLRFLYAAMLQAVDSGLAIRFEHETLVPKRR